jgi:hypothetical protein
MQQRTRVTAVSLGLTLSFMVLMAVPPRHRRREPGWRRQNSGRPVLLRGQRRLRNGPRRQPPRRKWQAGEWSRPRNGPKRRRPPLRDNLPDGCGSRSAV